MVIAIEPMLTEGSCDTVTGADGWTITTRDGGAAAHFEHSLAITNNGPMVLTKRR